MADMSSHNFATAQAAKPQDLAASPSAPAVDQSVRPIGIVLEINGAGSQVAIDLQRLTECAKSSDPAVALAGQVGNQIKIQVGKVA